MCAQSSHIKMFGHLLLNQQSIFHICHGPHSLLLPPFFSSFLSFFLSFTRRSFLPIFGASAESCIVLTFPWIPSFHQWLALLLNWTRSIYSQTKMQSLRALEGGGSERNRTCVLYDGRHWRTRPISSSLLLLSQPQPRFHCAACSLAKHHLALDAQAIVGCHRGRCVQCFYAVCIASVQVKLQRWIKFYKDSVFFSQWQDCLFCKKLMYPHLTQYLWDFLACSHISCYVDNTAQTKCHKAHVFVSVQADGRKWLQISIFLHLSPECSD